MAIYGAVVATGVAAYQFLRDRPGVKVFVSPSTTVIDGADERHVHLWRIKFVNHRKRPITIEEGGLLLEGKLRLPAPVVDHLGQHVEYPLPVVLGDGQSRGVYVPRHEGFMGVEVEGAWAKDALDRIYKTRYPGRNPVERLKAWRERRAFEKRKRERAA